MPLNASILLSVDFDTAEDYLIFAFHILFATSAVLVAGSVVLGISCTRAPCEARTDSSSCSTRASATR